MSSCGTSQLDSCFHYPTQHLTRQAFSAFQVRRQGQEYQHDFCIDSFLMTERRHYLGLPGSKAEVFNYLDRFSFHVSKEERVVKYLLAELSHVEL